MERTSILTQREAHQVGWHGPLEVRWRDYYP
jgi:hypothetical protein